MLVYLSICTTTKLAFRDHDLFQFPDYIDEKSVYQGGYAVCLKLSQWLMAE